MDDVDEDMWHQHNFHFFVFVVEVKSIGGLNEFFFAIVAFV